jgi:hypothetical protein
VTEHSASTDDIQARSRARRLPRTAWKPGQSGNPGGRQKVLVEVRDLARIHTREAIDTLVSIMRDETKSEHARIAAATQLLNRGWGLPPGHEWLMNLNMNVDARPSLAPQRSELSLAAAAILEDARRALALPAPPQVEAIDVEVEEVPLGPRLVSDQSGQN